MLVVLDVNVGVFLSCCSCVVVAVAVVAAVAEVVIVAWYKNLGTNEHLFVTLPSLKEGGVKR